MAEFILNPRRALRAPARCRTAVRFRSGSFEAETEDIGARGCQVVSPRAVTLGEPVLLIIANDHLPEPLSVGGTIAWVSSQFPWRVGIAFEEEALPLTTAWCERLVDAYPGLKLRRLPDKIPATAAIYLGTPPRFVVDFTPDEAAILRAIGSGVRVDELLARFRSRGEAIEHAIFSLIARSAVTLVRGQAVHPHTWKPVLDEIEAALAVDSLGLGPSTLAAPPEEESDRPLPPPRPPSQASSPSRPAPIGPTPPVSPFGTPPQDPSPVVELSSPGVAIEVEPPTPADADADAGPTWSFTVPGADHEGKGGGWRKGAKRRSPEAQAAYERAHAEFLAGNVNGAIALLRRALALSPGDPAIADVLGKLAFRDREPGRR